MVQTPILIGSVAHNQEKVSPPAKEIQKHYTNRTKERKKIAEEKKAKIDRKRIAKEEKKEKEEQERKAKEKQERIEREQEILQRELKLEADRKAREEKNMQIRCFVQRPLGETSVLFCDDKLGRVRKYEIKQDQFFCKKIMVLLSTFNDSADLGLYFRKDENCIIAKKKNMQHLELIFNSNNLMQHFYLHPERIDKKGDKNGKKYILWFFLFDVEDKPLKAFKFDVAKANHNFESTKNTKKFYREKTFLNINQVGDVINSSFVKSTGQSSQPPLQLFNFLYDENNPILRSRFNIIPYDSLPIYLGTNLNYPIHSGNLTLPSYQSNDQQLDCGDITPSGHPIYQQDYGNPTQPTYHPYDQQLDLLDITQPQGNPAPSNDWYYLAMEYDSLSSVSNLGSNPIPSYRSDSNNNPYLPNNQQDYGNPTQPTYQPNNQLIDQQRGFSGSSYQSVEYRNLYQPNNHQLYFDNLNYQQNNHQLDFGNLTPPSFQPNDHQINFGNPTQPSYQPNSHLIDPPQPNGNYDSSMGSESIPDSLFCKSPNI